MEVIKNIIIQVTKELLSKWVNSKYANDYIQAVYQYISKGTVIEDLDLKGKILYTG